MIPEDLKRQLYDVLLPMAFDAPLTYAGFLQVEECHDSSLPKHQSFREALDRMEPIPIPLILILQIGGRSGEHTLSELLRYHVHPAEPLSLLVASVRGERSAAAAWAARCWDSRSSATASARAARRTSSTTGVRVRSPVR